MARSARAQGSPVEPGPDGRVALRPLPGDAVRLDAGFWGARQLLNREVTIPHGLDMLEEWGALDNLRVAAGRAKKDYQLPLFMDSDVYKVLEAIAWERQHGPAQALERFYARTVGLLRAAQEPDGYINSYSRVVRQGERFSDPAMGHELYCAGHLLQAAVAEGRSPAPAAPAGATVGEVATRFADYLAGALPQVPDFVAGHPELEMALVETYRQRGDDRLLDLADELLRRRGRGRLRWGPFHADYFQDDVPVADARTVRGHAVRALYLLSGVADVYAETGRAELLSACTSQWEDMVSGKTYLTGGVGARHDGEAFGERFELPSERAYCETCAAIASVMWNWRMCLITGQARYAELLERTLYNGLLAGWGLDGKSFFYVNPLQVRRSVGRLPWYRCACCPPNLMRLLASLEHYVATRTAAGVQVHQFVPAVMGTEWAGGRFRARTFGGYPYDGLFVLQVEEAPSAPMELSIRLPTWSPATELELNGVPQGDGPGPEGYLRLRRQWRAGDEVSVRLDMRPRIVRPGPGVDSLRGCFALERGPLVYCFEPVGGAGRPGAAGLDALSGAPLMGVSEREARVAGEAVVELVVATRRGPGSARAGWPYHDVVAGRASSDDVPGGTAPPAPVARLGDVAELAAVPYYSWRNRGEGEMRVWLPELVGPGG